MTIQEKKAAEQKAALEALLAEMDASDIGDVVSTAAPEVRKATRVAIGTTNKVETEAEKAERKDRDAASKKATLGLWKSLGIVCGKAAKDEYGKLPGFADATSLKLSFTYYVQDGRKDGYDKGVGYFALAANKNGMSSQIVDTAGHQYTGNQVADAGLTRRIDRKPKG